MKIRKLNILPAVSLVAITFLSGCSKDDGPIPSRVTINDIPTISTAVDPTGSTTIPISNPASFSGKFNSTLYFPGTPGPEKVDIVVRKTNGTTINNNNVKQFKTSITAFPASFTVSVAEIQALFGVPIVLNDNYDFAPDIYVSGRKFEAFPLVGSGTGAGVRAMPLYSEFARYTVK